MVDKIGSRSVRSESVSESVKRRINGRSKASARCFFFYFFFSFLPSPSTLKQRFLSLIVLFSSSSPPAFSPAFLYSRQLRFVQVQEELFAPSAEFIRLDGRTVWPNIHIYSFCTYSVIRWLDARRRRRARRSATADERLGDARRGVIPRSERGGRRSRHPHPLPSKTTPSPLSPLLFPLSTPALTLSLLSCSLYF